MITQTPTIFRPSINIRFDLGVHEFVDRYIPIPSHIQTMKAVVKGLNNEGGKAHIIVGPYGSGKSLIGAILGGISSKKISSTTLTSLVEKLTQVDEMLGEQVQKLYDRSIRYIPVLFEGNVSNFRKSLLSALHKVLKEQNIPVTLPGLITEILSTVQLWETQYPDTFARFLRCLEEKNQKLSVWKRQVEQLDQTAISFFTGVYPHLTSGSQFIPSFSGGINGQLDHLLKELRERELGLFIIHDEFGRFLQSLSHKDTNEAMQDIQDLAELVDHNPYHNLSLLLITHRNMRQYAAGLSEEMQKEFQRIEKRFTSNYIESDSTAFVRIANYVTTSMREVGVNIEPGIEKNLSFHHIPELSLQQLQGVEGSYPIHPVTMLVMPKLANIVAQNERTLFMFLKSDEVGGLKKHFESEKDWYTAEKLFDYFEPGFDEFEPESTEMQTYFLYKRLLKRLVPSEYLEDQIKILKLLVIWDIARLHTDILPTTELLAFALRWPLNYANDRMEELRKLKVVRVDSEKRWHLYEGSIFDVEKEIDQRLKVLKITQRNRMGLLGRVLEDKFYLPKKYNDEKSITRFAYVVFVHADEIINNQIQLQDMKQSLGSDALIVNIISENNQQAAELKERIISLSKGHDDILFALSNHPTSNVYEGINRLAVIQQLQQDKNFLKQDKFLGDELKFLEQKCIHDLSNQLVSFIQLQGLSWFAKGTEIFINNRVSLTKSLTEMMEHLYPLTPVIRNEAYNRKSVTKVQINAAIKLLDQMITRIKSRSLEPLKITGNGPDHLIFATVLKNNGIVTMDPGEITDPNLIQLRIKLLEIVEKGEGTIEELVNICKSKPFGIREPIIPLLLIALLAKEWKYMMLYKHEIFISLMDGQQFWKIIDQPEGYTFSYQVIDEKYSPLVQAVEKSFEDHVKEEDRGYSTPVFVNRVLLRWLQSLPRLVQSTNKQSELATRFRQLIRRGQVKPIDGLDELYNLLDLGQEQIILTKLREECEAYLEQHLKATQKVISQLLKQDSFEGIQSWLNSYTPPIRKSSKLLTAIEEASADNWIDYIGSQLVGVERKNWSDATDDVFVKELSNELEYLQKVVDAPEENYVMFDQVTMVVPKVDLSKKSQVLYDNIQRTIQYGGRNVPKGEIIYLLWKLLNEASGNQETRRNTR